MFQPRDPDEARARFGIPNSAKIVCFVGNLVPWQGVDSLLRACASLRGSIPTLKLLVVGDGPESNRLRSLADQLGLYDRVVFTGSVPYADVSAFVCASDICAAPFIAGRKASPIKVYEYLACARPVVASDVDGIAYVPLNELNTTREITGEHAAMDLLTKIVENPHGMAFL